MGTKRVSYFFILFLIVFTVGILLVGKDVPIHTKMVTLWINADDDQNLEQRVSGIVDQLEGVETIFVDEKSNIFTFRYDSGKIDVSKMQIFLAENGLNVDTLRPVILLTAESSRPKKKLFQIKIHSSEQ
jgi:hypothetical protein